ncbi:MAG TPA: ABC transporter substrate-binding protein, partial [Gemmataceae bacterium]|nr:ABC transporter substrate-binding protein [Gemmataceae bacterium]
IGVDTYFGHINAEGGIAGRKLKLVPLDDGYEPAKALANMHELHDKHKAFAIIGNVGTPTTEKTLPFALDKQLIFFGAFTGAPLLRKDPPDKYVFNFRASYEEETAAMFSYLVDIKKIKPQQIAVFAQQDGYGDAGFRGVAKTMRKHGGDPDKILRVGHERNKTDVNDAVQKIAASPDIVAVIMVSTYRPASLFIQKVKDARAAKGAAKDLIFANVSFVGSNPLADELSQMGPKYAEGVIVTQVVPHINSQAAAVSKYRDLLAKYHPNAKPNFVSLEGYLDAVVFVEGLKRVNGKLTSDSLVAALESINNLDLGIGAPIHFGPSEHQASHKVWGTILDSAGKYQVLELD